MPARSVPVRSAGVRRGRVPAAELRRVARHVLGVEGVALAVEVEVVLADAPTVQRLNRLYRGRDEPTDVLSFAAHEPPSQSAPASLKPGERDERHPEPASPELGRRVEGPSGSPSAFAFVDPPDAPPTLGEVIVCLPVAEAQAAAAGHPLAGAVAHLVVHGLLHLLAYDHEEAADATLMQAREDDLLSALGYAGAYAHGH